MVNIVNFSSNCEFSLAVRAKLKKVFKNPSLYLDFPEIPQNVRAENWLLRQNFSICKKWSAYHIIDDGMGEYRDSLDVISQTSIVLSFSEFELNSHIWLRVNHILQESSDEITSDYEEILSKYVHGKIPLNSQFSKDIFYKINELSYDIKPENYEDVVDSFFPIPYVLEKITLEKTSQWIYYVLGTDIDFTLDELKQLKKNWAIA